MISVRDDQPDPARERLREQGLQLAHVAVCIAEALGFAQADPVDEARMVQGIAQYGVAFVEQRFEEPSVRVEAGAIEDRVAGAEKSAEGAFQLFVQMVGPADEADGSHPIAMFRKTVGCGLAHVRMVGETEVVVRAEVDDLALRHADLGALGRKNFPLALVETGRLDLGELLLDGFLE